MAGTRKRMELDERRNQLLDLGVKLFSENGYEDVSIEDIAREAGVSKGLLYHYFGGKQDFHAACVQLGADRLIEAIGPQMLLPPQERPKAGLEAYLEFVEQRSEAFLVLLQGGAGGAASMSTLHHTRDRLVDVAMQGVSESQRTPERRLAARAWQAAVEQASLEWLRHRDVTKDKVVEIMLAALVGIWQVIPPPIPE